MLNVYNPTGQKRDWAIGVEGGEVLVTGIKSWTEARDAAVAIALQRGIDTVLLHKINGTVQNVPVRKKANMSPADLRGVPEIAEGDVVYIARVQKSIDHDPETKGTTDTLEAAIKRLPRKAHGLNWVVNPYDAHTLEDGRIVSIEKTSA